mgnify:CR=1 FL=1
MKTDLLKIDSILENCSIFSTKINLAPEFFNINKSIKIFSERNPEDLPWGDLGVDVVMECTGIFTSKEKAKLHLNAGAKRVLISAPATVSYTHLTLPTNREV